MPDPGGSKSTCHFAAWLGLTPRSRSSGGKERLGPISKMGNPAPSGMSSAFVRLSAEPAKKTVLFEGGPVAAKEFRKVRKASRPVLFLKAAAISLCG